jgi:peptide/nickel transport system substrate-binding protein
MLETGEVDIALDLAPDDIPVLQSIPGINVAAISSSRRVGLPFNQQEERFQDLRVRQAFNYAIDWDEISDALLYGMSNRLKTYRGTDYCSDASLTPYAYDPERARALLEEANFPMDEEIVLNVAGNVGYRIQVVEAMASQLRQLGSASPRTSSSARSTCRWSVIVTTRA